MRLHGAWRDAAARPSARASGCRDRRRSRRVGEAIYQLAELDRLRGDVRRGRGRLSRGRPWGRLPGARPRAAPAGAGRPRGAAARRSGAPWPRPTDRLARRGCSSRRRDRAGRRRRRGGATARPTSSARSAARAMDAAPAGDGRPRAMGRSGSRRAIVDGALRVLRRAWEAWQRLDAPYEAARVRVLIAARMPGARGRRRRRRLSSTRPRDGVRASSGPRPTSPGSTDPAMAPVLPGGPQRPRGRGAAAGRRRG